MAACPAGPIRPSAYNRSIRCLFGRDHPLWAGGGSATASSGRRRAACPCCPPSRRPGPRSLPPRSRPSVARCASSTTPARPRGSSRGSRRATPATPGRSRDARVRRRRWSPCPKARPCQRCGQLIGSVRRDDLRTAPRRSRSRAAPGPRRRLVRQLRLEHVRRQAGGLPRGRHAARWAIGTTPVPATAPRHDAACRSTFPAPSTSPATRGSGAGESPSTTTTRRSPGRAHRPRLAPT